MRVRCSRGLSRPPVCLPCSAMPAREVFAQTLELLVSSLVWFCWLQRAHQCSWPPALPEIGLSLAAFGGKRGKGRCEQGFLGIASLVRLQWRALGMPCGEPGRHAAESWQPGASRCPSSRLPWPCTRGDRQGLTCREGTEQPWKFPGTSACIKHSASGSLQELCGRREALSLGRRREKPPSSAGMTKTARPRERRDDGAGEAVGMFQKKPL